MSKLLNTKKIVSTTIEYGALYNWWAATDTRKITSSDSWIVPVQNDFTTTYTYLGGTNADIGDFKETGFTYWDSPNTGATGLSGFNARGAGERSSLGGGFGNIKRNVWYFCTDTYINDAYKFSFHYDQCSYGGSSGYTNKKSGLSLRLRKTSTTLTNGQTSTYIGNDGKVYPTICIGTIEWLAANLNETKYRNGDWITGFDNGVYTLISDANWVAKTTEAMCYYNNSPSNGGSTVVGVDKILTTKKIVNTTIEYGALYNWYAAVDSRKISSSDNWVVPTMSQKAILSTYLGGLNVAGGKLKETGLTYWNTPNSGATNETGFNGRGSGERLSGGFPFISKNLGAYFICSDIDSYLLGFEINSNSDDFINRSTYKYSGWAIRLLYTGTGTPTSYTGNDGKTYRVVTIGTQTWLADNLNETKYRNGDWIAGFDNGTYTPIPSSTWTTTNTGAMCYYEDSISNGGSTTLGVDKVAKYTPITNLNYGLLYNSYASNDSRKISSSDDWIVPSQAIYDALKTYLGGENVSGGKMKETGITHWASPNTGATNETGFTAIPGGNRNFTTGAFLGITMYALYKTTTDNVTASLFYNDTRFGTYSGAGTLSDNIVGRSVRLTKDATGLPDGTRTIYVGNDGKAYSAVVINQRYWLISNLAETRFRNNQVIPWYGASQANYFTGTEWIALVTAGCCAYDNILSNVAPGFTFPT